MSSRYSSCYARQTSGCAFKLIEFLAESPDFDDKDFTGCPQDQTEVIYLAEQENTGFFHYEHWQDGLLLRRLKYADDCGWISAEGKPEEWEAVLLFSEENFTVTVNCWPPEMRRKIEAVWQKQSVAAGDSLPSLGNADLGRGLRMYWNLPG